MLTKWTGSAWLPHSAFREPSWRWIRAAHLIDALRSANRLIDDSWVERVRDFQLAHVDYLNDLMVTDESTSDPALATALRIWQAEQSLLRDTIEGYLLTEASYERIGAITGVSAAVIEAYHETFFDVRSRRQALDWIVSRVLRDNLRRNGPASLARQHWKRLAYLGGEYVLQLVIAITTDSPLPDELVQTFSNPEIDSACIRMQVWLFLALMTVSSWLEAHQIVLQYFRLREHYPSLPSSPDDSPILRLMERLAAGEMARPSKTRTESAGQFVGAPSLADPVGARSQAAQTDPGVQEDVHAKS